MRDDECVSSACNMAKVAELKQKLNQLIKSGINVELHADYSVRRDDSVPHAPAIPLTLTSEQFKLAVRNALRYFPPHMHSLLAKEFSEELTNFGN